MNLFKLVEKSGTKEKVLLIYTGGTLGMRFDEETKSLVSMQHPDLLSLLPELKSIETSIDFVSFEEAIDSSNVNTNHWIQWVTLIEDQYMNYTGFLILHGTDTMAYSASALSFMLSGLSKPVLFTGAQLPLGSTRNDAKRNILTSLELLISKRTDGTSMIQEVAIYFNDVLLRGNRTTKTESSDFDAFESKNYPALANTGVQIEFNKDKLLTSKRSSFKTSKKMNSEGVGSIKLFPGISFTDLEKTLDIKTKKIVVLETFGSGNAPTDSHFLSLIEIFIKKGGVVLNISQCLGGEVLEGKYKTNKSITQLGVINGFDLTFEAAVTKSMFVLANYPNQVNEMMSRSLSGEMSI